MMSIIINELNDLKVSIDQDNRKQILQALTSKTENQKKVKSQLRQINDLLKNQDTGKRGQYMVKDSQGSKRKFIENIKNLELLIQIQNYDILVKRIGNIVREIQVKDIDQSNIKYELDMIEVTIANTQLNWLHCEDLFQKNVKSLGPFEFDDVEVVRKMKQTLREVNVSFAFAVQLLE